MFFPENEANRFKIVHKSNGLATTGGHDDLFNEPAPDPGPSRPKPDNYLVQSILVLIFCCWPLGIPAVINASRVNTRWAEGDYEGAEEASGKAKQFAWIAFGLGLVAQVISFIIVLASGNM